MFFVPAHYTNIPVTSFFVKTATAHMDRGLQRFFPTTTFQHIPVSLECPKKSFTQQIQGAQPALTETFQTFQMAGPLTQIVAEARSLVPVFKGLSSHSFAAVHTASRGGHA